MPAYPTLSTRVIGQAEKSLNAILGRQLAGTGLSEPQWVILTLAINGGATAKRDQFTHIVADALKISEADAQASIDAMVAAQRLSITGEGSAVSVTSAAQQLHTQTRATIADITQRLWGDLPADALAAAGRVLTIITERANAELAR